MRSRSTRIISEVEKVWQRVMSIWYRSGNRAVRIPSSNELAEEFGIARSSVLRELFGIAGRDSGINVWTTMPESMPEYLLWHLQRHPGVRITRGHYRPHADGDSYFSRLRGQFASECPDWLLTTPEERGQIREIIISLYGVEKARSLLWVDLIEPGKDRGWPAYFFHSRRREEVQAAIDLLAPRLAGGGHDGEEARDVVVEAELVKI